MSRAPLRFLLAILAVWTGARAAILLPDWAGQRAELPAAAEAGRRVVEAAPGAPAPRSLAITATLPRRLSAPMAGTVAMHMPRRAAAAAPSSPPPQRTGQLHFLLAAQARFSIRPAPLQTAPFGLPAPPADRSGSRPLAASAWLLVREDGDPALAPGGTLGGSQAGVRLAYTLGGGVALGGRLYLPLRQPTGAELAAGIDWRPVRSLPVGLLAERRQRLGREGRSAFALTLYGGGSHEVTPRLRLDVYGQAGVVGLKSRDLFVDGAARLSRRIGPLALGAGAWGAAQPGAARLDAGPSLSWRLPVRDANLRLQADWRFRVAGEAAPGSGPALSLAADF